MLRRLLTPRAARAAMLLAAVSAIAAASAWGAATIGSAQVKDNSLQGRDVRNSTLRSADLAPGAVGPSDVAPSARTLVLPRARFEASVPSLTVNQGTTGTIASTSVRAPQKRRYLVSATIGMSSTLDPYRANCSFSFAGVPGEGEYIGTRATPPGRLDYVTLQGMSQALPAGLHPVQLKCSSLAGAITYTRVQLTLTEVSPTLLPTS